MRPSFTSIGRCGLDFVSGICACWAQARLRSVILGQRRPKIGQHKPTVVELGQLWSKFGQSMAQFCQTWPLRADVRNFRTFRQLRSSPSSPGETSGRVRSNLLATLRRLYSFCANRPLQDRRRRNPPRAGAARLPRRTDVRIPLPRHAAPCEPHLPGRSDGPTRHEQAKSKLVRATLCTKSISLLPLRRAAHAHFTAHSRERLPQNARGPPELAAVVSCDGGASGGSRRTMRRSRRRGRRGRSRQSRQSRMSRRCRRRRRRSSGGESDVGGQASAGSGLHAHTARDRLEDMSRHRTHYAVN